MPSNVFRGGGKGLEDVTGGAGAWFSRPVLGRGLAVGDLDGDGLLDLAAASLDAPPALLHNRSRAGGVVRLDLVARRGGTAFGARVRAVVGDRVLVRDLIGGGSYLSSSPPRMHLGIGGASRIDSLEVSWPWGEIQVWTDLRPGEPITLRERVPDRPLPAGFTKPNPAARDISAPRR
jgi:hypothetical protein